MRRDDAVTAERHLALVDAEQCAGLVADLWAARGYETEREGDVVLARRGGDPLTIYPMAGSRLAISTDPGRPVDVVVAPRGGWRGRAVAARHDATLLDAADLLELLRYAVAPTTADAICERHLGAPPGDLRPPLRDRVLGAGGGNGGRPVAAAAAGLALVLVAVGATLLAAPVDLPGGASEPETATAPPDIATADRRPPTTAEPQRRVELAPGVTTDGVVNVTALRDAHDRTLRNRSYVLRLRVYQPYGAGNSTPLRVKTDIAVEGDRYRLRTVLLVGTERTLVKEMYYDGDGWYSRQMGLLPADRLIVSESVSESPRDLRRSLVGRYLDTPASAVVQRGVSADGRHRVVGRGPPPGFESPGDEVQHYTVVALVSDRGVVSRASVEYTVASESRRYDGRFRWDYDRIGETTVEPPEWYREAFADGTDAADNRSDVDGGTAANETGGATAGERSPPTGRPASGGGSLVDGV